MFGRIVLCSALVTAAVASDAHEVSQLTGLKAVWPHMQRCTLEPVDRFAINTKDTGTSAGRGSAEKPAPVPRIELQLAGGSGNGFGPVVVAHAINTKGTGTSSGRGSSQENRVGVTCAKVDVQRSGAD